MPSWIPAIFVRRLRILLAASLLPLTAIPFGVITGPSAVASATPNLTFRVLGHDGERLAGATVGVRYLAAEGAETVSVETATTSSEGIASFALPATAMDIFYLANPAPSDTQNAVSLVPGWVLGGQSATLGGTVQEIKFSKGDLRLQIMRSDSVTPTTFAYIGIRAKFYKGLWGGLIRPGAFNLNLADLYAKAIQPTALRIYRINPLDDNESTYSTDFPWDYGLAKDASGQVQLYTDVNNSALVQQVAGVPTITFKQPNIRVNLKNSDGSQYRFPEYTSPTAEYLSQGQVLIHRIDDDGNILTDYNQIGTWSFSSAVRSGQMFNLIQGAPAGRYQVIFDNYGSWDFPRMSRDIWEIGRAHV